MSLEAQLGSQKAFLAPVNEVRPHPGQKASAANLIKLLAESELMESHKDCPMVQDALITSLHASGAWRIATGF